MKLEKGDFVRLLALCLVMLMFPSLTFAAQESHQLGPYKVDFNVNTNAMYQVQTPPPVSSATVTAYPLVISTDNKTGASLSLIQYNKPAISTLDINEEILALRMALSGINATSIQPMTIDGKDGFLITGMPIGLANAPSDSNVPSALYQGGYWLDSKNCECGPVSVGTTMVQITSTYPQDVTRDLINSIHVATGK